MVQVVHRASAASEGLVADTVCGFCRTQSPSAIAAATLKEPAVIDMLSSLCPEATFAMRVHVVPYPEGVLCAWVMLAVKIRETGSPTGLQILSRPE